MKGFQSYCYVAMTKTKLNQVKCVVAGQTPTTPDNALSMELMIAA